MLKLVQEPFLVCVGHLTGPGKFAAFDNGKLDKMSMDFAKMAKHGDIRVGWWNN